MNREKLLSNRYSYAFFRKKALLAQYKVWQANKELKKYRDKMEKLEEELGDIKNIDWI